WIPHPLRVRKGWGTSACLPVLWTPGYPTLCEYAKDGAPAQRMGHQRKGWGTSGAPAILKLRLPQLHLGARWPYTEKTVTVDRVRAGPGGRGDEKPQEERWLCTISICTLGFPPIPTPTPPTRWAGRLTWDWPG